MEKIIHILNSFKKEYANHQAIYNIAKSLLVCSIIILIFSFLEQIFYFSENYRKKIFYFILSSVFLIISYNLLSWVIAFFALFNNNSNEKSAFIIGSFYPKIKDRLLNVIQLNKVSSKLDLTILATQNVLNDLKKINFKKFFITKFNYKRSLSLSICSMIIIGILNLYYIEPFNRLVKYNMKFSPQTPFTLHSLKKDIYAENGENISVLFISKRSQPDSINVVWKNENQTLHKKIGSINDTFKYTLNNIKSNLIYWAEYDSPKIISTWDSIKTNIYNIELIDRPYYKKIEFTVIPPDYTKLPQRIYDGKKSTHIDLLHGSKFLLNLTSNIPLSKSWARTIGDSTLLGENKLELKIDTYNSHGELMFYDNLSIKLFCENINSVKNIRPIEYKLDRLNDRSPSIIINSPNDEFTLDESYKINLNTNINDDYGISDIGLIYTIKAQDELEAINYKEDTLKLNYYLNDKKNISILESWDIQNIPILMGDELHFYIYAIDNNPYNPSTSKSKIIIGKFPTLDELFSEIEGYENDTFETLDDMEESIDDVLEDINKIELDLLKSDDMSFENKKQLEKNIEEIKDAYNKIEELQKNIETILEKAEQNNLFDEQLIEKFGHFQEMLQELMSQELLSAIEDLNKAMEKMNQEQMMQALENFEFNIENFEKELDRFIDMFEMAKAEQQLNELSEIIENMIEKQTDIIDQLNTEDLKIDMLTVKSNKQQNRFEKFENLLEETEKTIESISENISNQINNLKNSELISQTKIQLNNTSEKMKNNETNLAKESSQNTKENLNELSELIQEIKENFIEEEMQEILSDFIIIIDNLLTISYQQEKLIVLSNGVRSNSPLLREINFKQNNLDLEMNQIVTQIMALSSKTFFVNPEIGRSFGKIKSESNKIKSSFAQKNIRAGKTAQKSVIQNINHVILLLLESLDELQKSESLSGFEQFLESMQSMSEKQQGINQSTMQLSQLGLSEQQSLLNELLGQQQQLKKQLEEMMSDNSGDNPGSLDKISDDMEEILQDFKNNNINQKTIERQQEILSRMLDSQKSMQKKDFSKKRESQTNNENFIYLGPNGLPEDLGDKNLLLINAMEAAIDEGFSEEYNQHIRKYFLNLQKSDK